MFHKDEKLLKVKKRYFKYYYKNGNSLTDNKLNKIVQLSEDLDKMIIELKKKC